MKTYCYIAVLILLFPFCATAQNEDAIKKDIDDTCRQIDLDGSLQIITSALPLKAPRQSTHLTGYMNDNGFRKISSRHSDSITVLTTDFYFSNNKLIYVHESEKYFSPDPETGEPSTDPGNMGTQFVGLYYFLNWKMLYGETMGKRSVPYKKGPETELIDKALQYHDLLQSLIKK